MNMLKEKIHTYNASFTTGALMLHESQVIIPLLLSADAEGVKREVNIGEALKLNAFASRRKKVGEITKRFKHVKPSVWQRFMESEEQEQMLILYYACLKTYNILKDFQIPGSDVQRWMRDWKGDQSFQSPEDYRPLSMSNLSTHDMTSFPLWWKHESTPEEKKSMLTWADCSEADPETDFPSFVEKVFEKVLATKSVFSIHALQDWLALTGDDEFFKIDHRINQPGQVHSGNWSIRLPLSLEQMLLLPINVKIRRLVENSGRKV